MFRKHKEKPNINQMFRTKITGTTQSDYDSNEYRETEIKLYIVIRRHLLQTSLYGTSCTG